MKKKKALLMLTAICYLIIGCSNSNKSGLTDNTSFELVKIDTEPAISELDTTIYESPYYTAEIEDAVKYFRENNKYKDWPKNNAKTIIVQCIAEKDSTSTRIKVLKTESGNKDLDNEAIRLIKDAKISPAGNGQQEPIRSLFTIAVHFPPK